MRCRGGQGKVVSELARVRHVLVRMSGSPEHVANLAAQFLRLAAKRHLHRCATHVAAASAAQAPLDRACALVPRGPLGTIIVCVIPASNRHIEIVRVLLTANVAAPSDVCRAGMEISAILRGGANECDVIQLDFDVANVDRHHFSLYSPPLNRSGSGEACLPRMVLFYTLFRHLQARIGENSTHFFPVDVSLYCVYLYGMEKISAERKNLTMPADWWAAFSAAAAAEGCSLAEWLGEAARRALPAHERKGLSPRVGRGRPASREKSGGA